MNEHETELFFEILRNIERLLEEIREEIRIPQPDVIEKAYDFIRQPEPPE